MLTGCERGSPRTRCLNILRGLPPEGILRTDGDKDCPFRIAPEPFPLSAALAAALARQGRLWLGFLRASQSLYFRSLRGEAPGFISEYLDSGKPKRVLDFGRMNRFRTMFPALIRPDLILTDEGPAACELDSVPGGFGLLACLARLYAGEGFDPVGGPDGVTEGFRRAMSHITGNKRPAVAIVVSEESKMYFPEMSWLAGALREAGFHFQAAGPEDLSIREEGVFLDDGAGPRRLDAVYRFFELFDLPNVPQAGELLNAAKLRKVAMTPPPKAHFEEKILFALLHHPALAALWEKELGERDFGELKSLVIPTWVLDARPVPPHAVIAGPGPGGRGMRSWEELAGLSQKEREFVIKPSGFSESAWGSHGVMFGHDLSRKDWTEAIVGALERFPTSPSVLQVWRRPSLVPSSYLDRAAGEIRDFTGRVRLCPYYFVTGPDEAGLAGVLATVCPADKKAIHGMSEAVMVPCSVAGGKETS